MSLHSPRRQRGMTLVELLVAMAIGLVVTLAVTSIVIIGESNKRTTAATNDTNQTGSFAAFALDRLVRSAGSGFAQSWNLGVFGCRLSVSRVIGGTATTILPRTAAFPAPFAGVLGGAPTNLRVAPVLIANGQSAGGSDVLVVMGGNAATGDIPRAIRTPYPFVVGANSGVRLDNTIGLSNLDLGLVSQNGITDCLIEQVTVAGEAAPPTQAPYTPSPFLNTPPPLTPNQLLPLAGQYFTASGATTSLATLTNGTSYFTPLGNLTAGNAQFALIGVDANRTLIAYDLLRNTGAGSDAESLQAVAEGVTEMHAIYGMDTNNDGTVDTWIDPASAGYDIASLMVRPPAMTTTAPYTIRQIMAIRVALVLRGSNYEKEVVTLVRPKLFPGTPGEIAQVNLTGDDQHYRYRVIDTTIPLRDMLLLPNS